MRSASRRVAHANWSGPGTAQMAYHGVALAPLPWITTSPVSGMLSGMVASRKTHRNVLRPRSLLVVRAPSSLRVCLRWGCSYVDTPQACSKGCSVTIRMVDLVVQTKTA